MSRWARLAMIILAVGLAVTALALVSALHHTSRLEGQLASATAELELARSFRLLVRRPSLTRTAFAAQYMMRHRRKRREPSSCREKSHRR